MIESLIKSFGTPFVVIDNKLSIKNVDFVLADDIGGSFKLVDHLISVHGLKRIACISASLEGSSDLDKLEGYKKALAENNILVDDDYIKIGYPDEDRAYQATKELLNLKDKPEAIYCINTNMLVGCFKYLIENGIKVPDDVAVVAFDDCNFTSAINPPVTTLKRIDLNMGEIAADLLFKNIEGNKDDYKEIRIDSELVIRKSCGCK
jgi:LacI family transcriptional regulator